MMQWVPAIMLQGEKCVVQGNEAGKYEAVEIDPAELASRWSGNGFERLHVIDIDGIKQGSAANQQIVENIVKGANSAAVQLRGGVRDEETVQQYLEVGVQFIVLGTRAVSAPHFVKDLCLEYPGHILVGLDMRDGRIAVDGWSKLSNHDVHDLVIMYQKDGVDGVVYSNIDEAGISSEPVQDAVNALAEEVTIPIFTTCTATDVDAAQEFGRRAGKELAGAILVNAACQGLADFKPEDLG